MSKEGNNNIKSNLKINGFVEIINGETRIVAENKFVQNMLIWLVNMTAANHIIDNTTGAWYISTSAWDIFLGTNTTTPTAYNTSILATPIGGGSGTAANIKTGSTYSPSSGIYRVIFTATWNPGTVSGTVGEMALYITITNSLQVFGWTPMSVSMPATPEVMVSRLAVADGSLSVFPINTINPLTINWTVQYGFT